MKSAMLIFILEDTMIDEIVLYGSLFLILVIFVLSVYETIRSYRRVRIRFVSKEAELPAVFKIEKLEEEIKKRIRTAVGNYQRASHTDGHISLNRDFAFTLTPILSQKTAEKITSSVPKKLNPLQKLLNQIVLLLSIFLKPPLVVCSVFRHNATYKISLEFQTKGLTSKIISYGEVELKQEGYNDSLDLVVTKILYQLAGEDDTGIRREEAFHLFRAAFREWPHGIYNRSEKGDFDKVKGYLLRAHEIDENSPLINYHLGIIDYYYYSYYPDEVDPIEYFSQAEISSQHLPRLNYLAIIGACRCLCQDYHRYGDNSDKVRELAIAKAMLARERIEKQRNVPAQDWCRVYYCLAFAHHITEDKEDIETGIQYYQKAINVYYPHFSIKIDERKRIAYQHIDQLGKNPQLTVVYNNLGYILMAYHSRFVSSVEAEDYLMLAEELEKWAVSSDPNYYLGYANLANIQRLRGDYQWAISNYKKTIALKEDYISGYAELAWVYKEMGELDNAYEYMNKALEMAPSEKRKKKIRREFEKIKGKVVA